jgi:diaminopropionate ammonia-lyase
VAHRALSPARCHTALPLTGRHVDVFANPHRGVGLPADAGVAAGTVVADPTAARALLARCPVADTTPLLALADLAPTLGVAQVHAKDERGRMGLGSFKALGAGHAIARMAADRVDRPGAPADEATMRTALEGVVITCASAGNHGLAVAAAARVFGARAVVHLAEGVPDAFARRLRARGAEVVRAGADYEASMAAAEAAAAEHGWVLLSDSSWPGYVDLPRRVMEGYLVLASEVVEAMDRPPTHVFLQAGVGGLAAAVTALFRDAWGDDPTVVVVEPTVAPALAASIRAGRPVVAPGPVSTMGRLDCKEPSHLALAALARQADHLVVVDDDEVARTVDLLAAHGVATTPSGAAGLAGLHHAGPHRSALGLGPDSRVLVVVTEGPEDAP